MIGDFIKNNKRAVKLMLFYFIVILGLAFLWPKKLDWGLSFSELHKKPYGAKVLHNELESLFPNASFQTSDKPIYNTVHDSVDVGTNAAYIFLNQSFITDSLELSKLFAFVEKGNTAFISATDFDESLLDTLHLLLDREYDYGLIKDTFDFVFIDSRFSQFSFPDNGTVSYLEPDSLFVGEWLSTIRYEDLMSQVQVPFGKGNFILNSYPLGFTNFYILNAETRNYAAHCLSYLGDVEHIIWDENYKRGKPGQSRTPLIEILKIPGLRWAFWLSLSTVLLFMGFHSKRKQRIIPIEEPVRNTSVEYVETMGNLYYEQSTKFNIAVKKIEYFKTYLARTHNLNNINFSEDDVKRLSARTDMSVSEVQELFALIYRIKKDKNIDTETLKKLNSQINNFYK